MRENLHSTSSRVLIILFALIGLAGFLPLEASAQGIITTVAGGGAVNPIATSADMPLPQGIALDSSGNVYIAVTWAYQVLRLDTSGKLTVFAGTGSAGYSGDGGPATSAMLSSADAVAVDAHGNVFIADASFIRRVDASTGIITTVAGNGTNGYSGDGGPATSASISVPWGNALAFDSFGNLFIADLYNMVIRRVDAATQIITTVAGNGTPGYSGDGGPATAASLCLPTSVAVDAAGNLFIADTYNNVIRRVDAGTQIITTYAGNSNTPSYPPNGPPSGVGGAATGAAVGLPNGVALDSSGNLFIADSFGYLWRVDHTSQIITLVAGNGTLGFAGDGGAATSAALSSYVYPTIDASGNIFIVDQGNNRIRRIDATSQVITTVAGGGMGGDGGPATSAVLGTIMGVAVDNAGNAFIPDQGNYRVRRVDTTTGNMTTVAGSGIANLNIPGDNVPASGGFLPSGVAVDAAGNLFVEDIGSNTIQRVAASTGTITTAAGNGTGGYSGDGGSATNASLILNSTPGVTVDNSGNLFIADTGNCAIRRVDAVSQIITTVAGNGTCGYSGDGGLATSATLSGPINVAVDGSGDLFIADHGNHRVRRVDGLTGIITTVAGNGVSGFSGDGGPATDASLRATAVALDSLGNLFVSGGDRIRRVDSVTGFITTVAGNGSAALAGDGGPAQNAVFDGNFGLAVDGGGNIFVADQGNRRIRRISAFPFASVSNSSLTFPNEPSGVSSPSQTVTLYNTGTATLGISGITMTGGYTQTNTCGSSLASGASCTISVTPTTGATQTGELTITDNSNGVGGSVTNVSLQTGATITTIAGGGPNNLPALSVGVASPQSVVFDANGNYYVSSQGQNRVFKVDASGTLTVFAGTGGGGFAGDGGPATSANLANPQGLAVDGAGNVYIADAGNRRVRIVAANTGIINTFAGLGSGSFPSTAPLGDGGPATSAILSQPYGVAVDPVGNVYIADTFNNKIRMVDTTGTIWTIAGNGTFCPPAGPNACGDGGPATQASLAMPMGVAVGPGNFVLVADTFGNRIRVVVPGGPITTAAGVGSTACPTGPPCFDPISGADASLNMPHGATWISPGQIVGIADTGNNRIVTEALYPATFSLQQILLMTGNCQMAHGPCVQASLGNPQGLAVGPGGGSLYIADTGNNRIDVTGGVLGGPITVAGNGTTAWAGDGGPALNASFSLIPDVELDQVGNVIIPDRDNHCVRKMDASTGIISTIAGNPMAPGYGGDGGAATSASLGAPAHVTVDGAGNLFIADQGNNTVRRVDATTGLISTVAGTGTPGYSGDGGPAYAASLNSPHGVRVDGAGNVYIADTNNNRIRMVDTTGAISTVAGNGSPGFSGDGGPAILASLNGPHDVWLDGKGNLYITDTGNSRIRVMNLASGVINTVIGNGVPTYGGDGGPAVTASLNNPEGVRSDSLGNLYIPDGENNRIRKVDTTGTITTVAGNGIAGFSGDGGPATNASLNVASGVVVDKAGGLLIADSWNFRIRFVGNTPTGSNIAVPPVDTTTGSSPVILTFPSITQIGNTSLTTSSTGQAPPSGFGLGSPPIYYNLITSAVYTGEISICINYGGITFNNPNDAAIWRYDTTSSTWTELTTTTLDTATTTICASTPSLSPFAIFVPAPPSVALSATTLVFGAQNLGTTSAAQTETVANTGGSNLLISTVTIGGMNAGDFATSSDTCTGATVTPNSTCTVSVTFSPTATGPLTSTLTITDNSGGVAGSQQTVALTGVGISGAASVSPASRSFGDQALGTASAAKTVILANSGTTNLILASITFTGTNASDFAESDDCPASLAPRVKCTISVTFTPSQLGAETAALTLADSAANSPQSVALSGTGVVPVALSPISLSFGKQAENVPSPAKTITLTNNLDSPLAISSIATSGDFAQTNNCGTSVPANSKCTISVTFTPSIVGGETGDLTVTDSASTSPQTASLSGTGVVPATLSPISLSFGNQPQSTTSAAKNVTLTNNLDSPLAITITTSGDFAQTSDCGVSVPADGKCTISVTFTPSIIGGETGTLTVTDGASNSPQTAALAGTGIVQAKVAPISLTFAKQAVGSTSAGKSVTLTNNLSTALPVNITFTGANAGDFAETDTCSGSVTAGSQCTITVTFTPTGSGTRTATLNVNDSANNSPQTVALTGTGK